MGIARGFPARFPAKVPFGAPDAVGGRLLDPLGVTTLRDPRIRALVARALDAARSAGAQYADVRVTNTRTRTYNVMVKNTETLGIGVRALVDGVWGFASSPYITDDEGVRLGKTAVAEAKSIGRSPGSRSAGLPVDLGKIPAVPNGDWSTPIVIDPFEVAEAEILDWLYGVKGFIEDYGETIGREIVAILPGFPPLEFMKQERVVGSSEGTYVTQTLYQTDANLAMQIRYRDGLKPVILPGTGFVGAGLEWVYDNTARIRDAVPQLIAQEDANQRMPVKPLEVGRYNMAFSTHAMAAMLSSTLGPATEVDRALGYEANASGTSYLGPDPGAVLGTSIAAPLITVTANRSAPRGVATVQWDDEGVVPDDFTLVEQGTLIDYQTTREQAAWLAPWYQKQGEPIRSHGCATSPTAQEPPMQHTPNLALHPGVDTIDFETLVAGMTNGVAIDIVHWIFMDQQCISGLALTTAFEIKNGKRVARLASGVGSAGVIFRSLEFWKNITTLGGSESVQLVGKRYQSQKGEPEQQVSYSVSAVPAVVKMMALVDPAKKA